MADATAETATTDTTSTEGESTATEPTLEERLAKAEAEAEKWRTNSRKNEDRAKQNSAAAKELEALRQSAMSDQERAVAEARAQARAEALREAGGRLVDAELRVAANGRTFDTDALLALDRSQFLTDDGDVDSEAIKAWVEEHSSVTETTDNTQQKGPLSDLDLGQGSRESTPIGDDAAFRRMLTDLVK